MNHLYDQKTSARTFRLIREQAGVTLVELMAATVISLVVVGAGFTALIASNKATQVSDMVANTQQNVRLAMELLSRDVKLAGFGMTGPVGACTVAGVGAPILPGDNAPAGLDTGPDTITMVVPNTNTALAPVWTLAAQADGPFTTITMQGGSVADMQAAGMVVGTTVSIGGAISSDVQSINAGADTITVVNQIGAPKVFPTGTQVFLLECVTYSIGGTAAVCGGNSPCLMRSVNGGAPIPLVEGIEDIQFAYACDGCNAAVAGGVPDGIPDDFDGVAGFTAGDFVTNNTWNLIPMTPEKIKLVQINVVGRQTVQDSTRDRGISESDVRQVVSPNPLQVSDHNHSNDAGFSLPTYQLERRRALTRTVQTRNVGP